jgi:hypothetical protein
MDGREMDLTGNRIGECGRRVAQDTDLKVIGSESVDVVWLSMRTFK